MGSACCADEVGVKVGEDLLKTDRRQNNDKITPHDSSSTDINTSYSTRTDTYTDSDCPPSNNSLSYTYDTSEFAEKAVNGFKIATQTGNDAVVMHFIEEYPSLELLNVQFENGNNALHIAVQNESYNLILYLLTNGISPNRQNDFGESALHSAVRINNLKIVTLLTKYTAVSSLANIKNETPLTIATANKYYDIVCLFSPQTQRLLSTYIQTQRSVGVTEEKSVTDRDPFINLKRVKTKVALQEIHGITCKKSRLPQLEGFLEKRQGQIPYRLQRRWVIVKDSYILWSDIRRNIIDTKVVKERKKFNNSIHLMAITNIEPVTKGKTQRRFVIEVLGDGIKNKKLQYLWKCSTRNERDLWVNGLRQHIKHLKSIISYLGAND